MHDSSVLGNENLLVDVEYDIWCEKVAKVD